MERRTYDAEWRVAGEPQIPQIVEGYAALYDTLSLDLGGFRERILRGAFSRALNADVRALINHDDSLVLGRTVSGTLALADDERGLRVRILLPDTTYARDLVALMQRGDINQMSFAFRSIRDRWTKEQGEVIRELIEVELYDVSIVTYPAYIDTSAELRAMAGRAAQKSVEPYVFLLKLKSHGG